jgi:hypothetical protein
MKGLAKDISSVTIAGLILASGAIAADAQVVAEKNPHQDTQKSQDLQVTTKSLPLAKQVVNTSPNQAKYLKLAPNALNSERANLIAQSSDSDGEALRNKLRIEPLTGGTSSQKGYSPSLNFGTPSAFGANWGDAFISASGATAGKARNGQIDGSISGGFGLGNGSNAVGLELGYNQGSIRNFGSNGTFDAKAHRIVYSEGTNTVGVAVGWNTFAQHGNEGVANSSVYGAVSTYSLLQANDKYNKMPVSFTVGVGGGQFRQGNASTGVFAGAGLQIDPQVGVGLAWSGVGINAGLSYVPYPAIPLTFTLTGADLTNNSAGGTVLILSVGYGFNFLPK